MVNLNIKMLPLVSLVPLLFSLEPVIGQQIPIKEASVIGSWYMNTPAKTCRLVLRVMQRLK
jgi:hypothetical protein